MMTLVFILIGCVLVPVIGLLVLSVQSARPVSVGVTDGRLKECPDSPNCVSSQAEDRTHWIAPLACRFDVSEVPQELIDAVRALPGTTVVSQSANYLHVEFRSPVFGFVDDVEFLVQSDLGQIHVRSASRVGRSDLGANRRRVEEIRRKLAIAAASHSPQQAAAEHD